MQNDRNQEEKLIQNLQDAGCTSGFIDTFLNERKTNDTSGQMKLLHIHRSKLLDTIHQEQRKLDCLDYLLFHLKKKN